MTNKFRQIQIATDEMTIRLAVARAFRDTSVDVVVASNTFQALSQLDVFEFDLFLLDLDMKDGCSFGLLETMTERFPKVPTILLTTNESGSEELKHRIKDVRFSHCWDILSKPFDYKKLVGFIDGSSHEYPSEHVQYHQHKHENWLEKRNCQRFSRFEQIAVTRADTKEKKHQTNLHWCTLTNISLGGMGMTTDLKLIPRKTLHFDEKFMHQDGTVVWVKEKVDHLWEVGVKFL